MSSQTVRRICLGVLLSVSSACFSCATQIPGKRYQAIRFYNNGLNYGARGEYQDAVIELEKAVATHDAFPEAWFNLAIGYEKLKETEHALYAYQKALEFDPKLFEARVGFAEKLHEKGIEAPKLEHKVQFFTQAKRHYSYILSRDPYIHQLQYRLALLLEKEGKSELALQAMENAWKANPLHLKTAHWLAKAYLKRKNYAKCLHRYLDVYAVDKEDQDVLKGVVRCYTFSGKKAEARDVMGTLRKKFNNASWVLKLESEVQLWP